MPSSILYGVCDVLERNRIYTEHYTIKTFTTTSIHRWAKNRKILSPIYKSADGDALPLSILTLLKASYPEKNKFFVPLIFLGVR